MAKFQICEVEDCVNPVRARSWCKKHYESWRTLGSPTAAKPKKRNVGKFRLYTCSVEGCDRQGLSRGYCNSHYHRWLRNGDVAADVPIKPSGKKRRWIDANGYVSFSQKDHPEAGKNGRVLEHRAVMAEKLGRPLRKGENVHHRNGNRADNRPENLELWVKHQPAGQRVSDLLAWAHEIIDRYE